MGTSYIIGRFLAWDFLVNLPLGNFEPMKSTMLKIKMKGLKNTVRNAG